MKRLVLVVLLLAQPAWAQMKKDAAKRADRCAPIGRTEDGKLVYAMTCETPPKPVAAVPPQAQPTPEPQAASEPETERTGLFGMSYDRRPKQ